MRRLVLAVCLGAIASAAALWGGEDRPGRWVAESIGGLRPYDLFIHDHYLIVRPIAFLVNFVAFSLVAYGLLALARGLGSRHGSAAA